MLAIRPVDRSICRRCSRSCRSAGESYHGSGGESLDLLDGLWSSLLEGGTVDLFMTPSALLSLFQSPALLVAEFVPPSSAQD
jgi:hypothetical protein